MKDKNVISLAGFGWCADVMPKYGMNTIRLSHHGKQILRHADNMDFLLGAATLGYGSALLMPPDRTEHAHFQFDGQVYYLQMNEPRYQNHIHGLLRNASFRVEEETETSVRASYRNIGELFPFPFLVTTHYYLDETGYHQSITFENIGKADMPLTVGLHVNFIAPEWFRIPLKKKWLKNGCHIPTGELVDLTEEEEAFCIKSRPKGQAIFGSFTSAGTTAQLGDVLFTVSENFDQWQLWNGDGNKGVIRIEPQCGAVNCLNSGMGLLRLKPGQKETFRLWFHTI